MARTWSVVSSTRPTISRRAAPERAALPDACSMAATAWSTPPMLVLAPS